MRTIQTFYGITVDLSEEVVRARNQNLEGYACLARKLEHFAELDSAYIREFLSRRGYGNLGSTIRMLEAHGYPDKQRGFLYADLVDEKLVWEPVDSWLDLHDGQYEVLFVSSCNPGELILRPRRSTLIYPIGKLDGSDFILEALQQKDSQSLRIVEPKVL